MVGNVTPKQAWETLLNDPGSQLVDVRTEAEWNVIGLPDLGPAGKQVVLISWQFGDGSPNPRFAEQLAGLGLDHDARMLFICRSGVRSMAAAKEAEAAGFKTCDNVTHGFEGHPDAAGRRGTLCGWQADGLPRQQKHYRA